jgi:hypothetical protein
VYRHINEPLELIASGDYEGALESARMMSDAAPGDPNLQMRLGLSLLAAGEPEGRTILLRLAARNDKWVILMRRTFQRYGIDPSALSQLPDV